jgi:signal transduction histidine kinase
MNPRLVALAVHDLKNALGALEGELDVLEADPSTAKARAARRHCVQLRQRFVAFLTLYRATDDLRAMVSDESPQEFIAGIARHAEPEPEPGATARLVCGAGATAPAFWYFDPRLVRLAMDAALHNALRFARREVVIDSAEVDGWLVISVDDDGPGLGPEGGAVEADDGAGDGADWSTGLGTELCRAVARAHRNGDREGRVTLANRPKGGARFELWLP